MSFKDNDNKNDTEIEMNKYTAIDIKYSSLLEELQSYKKDNYEYLIHLQKKVDDLLLIGNSNFKDNIYIISEFKKLLEINNQYSKINDNIKNEMDIYNIILKYQTKENDYINAQFKLHDLLAQKSTIIENYNNKKFDMIHDRLKLLENKIYNKPLDQIITYKNPYNQQQQYPKHKYNNDNNNNYNYNRKLKPKKPDDIHTPTNTGIKDIKPVITTDPILTIFGTMLRDPKKEEKKVDNNCLDEDEDYDGNAEIYMKTDDLPKDDDNNEFVDLGKIKSIVDLINIGEKYKDEVNEYLKIHKKEVKEVKKNKKEEIKEDEPPIDASNIFPKEFLQLLFKGQITSSDIAIENTHKILDKHKEEFEDETKEEINKQIDDEIKKNIENNNTYDNNDAKKISESEEVSVNKEIYELNEKKYSINLEILVNLINPLKKLDRMVGMKNVKDLILNMILYYLQNFEKNTSNMLHTTIEGPPGVGKTRVGKLLAEIYAALGIIKSPRFTLVKRTDLIGQYLGHTATKTQKVIDEADGGVLFLDEAYSLGEKEGKDSFAKEAIDTINQNLSEKKKNLIVIVAGYPDKLDSCFFSYNDGLKRRFPFRITIDGYNNIEMKDIFYDNVRKLGWKLHPDVNEKMLTKFFETNKDNFKHFGGDIETLTLNCKLTHSKRVVNKNPKFRKIITLDDFNLAFEQLKINSEKGKDKDSDTSHLSFYA
jgi:hypothetical protein